MKIQLMFLLMLFCALKLHSAELPEGAQKALDKSDLAIAQIQNKADQEIVKIKIGTVKKLQRLLKKTKKTNSTHRQLIEEQIALLNEHIQATDSNEKDRRVSTLIRNLKAGKKQLVVTYGTSLTANGAWVTQMGSALKAEYPNLLSVINSGGSGKYSQWGVENFQGKVLDKNPDCVFIEFSMNDCVTRFNCSVEEARKNLTHMIDTLLAKNKNCEIILMTMTPGNHGTARKNIEGHYEMYRNVAQEYKLRLIDHIVNWKALQNSDPQKFKSFVPDEIHPNSAGCAEIITPVILGALKGTPKKK